MTKPLDLDAIKANLPKPYGDRKYTNEIGRVLYTVDEYCTGCGCERGLLHRRDCLAMKEAADRRAADEAVASAEALGVFVLVAEVERLRDLAYPEPLPLSEASGDGPAMLWWRSAPIEEPPCHIGHPGDSGWPFTADDDPIWIPMPTLSADRPKVIP